MARTRPCLIVSIMLLLATALAALAAAALASALDEGPTTDETHSLADARELDDGDAYAGHLQRATDKSDTFKVTAAQRTVVDVHVRIDGHDGTGEWTAPPRTTPPGPPTAPYDSCMLDCYMYAGPSTAMAIDGAFNYYYVRDYSLSACAPVPGTAWYYIELDVDWRWTPNDHVWDYTVEVHLSQPVEVAPGTPVTGTIDLDARDTHWYSVRATLGSELWGSMEITNFDTAAPEERNIDVWAFPDDMGGYPRAIAWDWSAAPNEPVEPFSVLATYDGLYYIKLRGMNHDVNLPCSYRLEVRVDPVPEFPAGGVWGAYLDRFSHDTDWYRFTMRADQPWEDDLVLWNEVRHFNLTERPDAEELPDFDLYLFGLMPGGRMLDLLDSSFRGDHENFMSPVRDPNRNSEEVRAAAFYNGTYYIEVNDYNNTGFYDLREDDRMRMVSDSDNMPLGAHRAYSGVYSSHINQAFDHYDWYKGDADDWFRVQFDSFKPTDIFNCSIYKYDAVANRFVLVAGDWNVHFCATSGEDALSNLIDITVDLRSLGLGAGTYYVCVFAAEAAETGFDPGTNRAFVYTTDADAEADYEVRIWGFQSPPPSLKTRPIPPLIVDEDTNMPRALNLTSYFILTDVGAPPLKFKAYVIAGKLSKLVLEGSVLGFIASPDFYGKVVVKVSAIDKKYQETRQTWEITFLPINDAPRPKVALPFRFNLTEDTAGDLDLAGIFYDVESGDTLSFAIGQGTHLTIGLTPGSTVASLVLAQDWFGEEVIDVTATDPDGASTVIAVTFAVEGVPDAPRLLRPLGEFEMMEDGVLTVRLNDFFFDPDGGALSYSVSVDWALLPMIDAPTGDLTLTPVPYWYGSRELSVTATDIEGLTVSSRMLVIVIGDGIPYRIEFYPPGSAVSLKEGISMAFEARMAQGPEAGLLFFEWRLDGRLVGVSWSYWLETGYNDAGIHALVVKISDEQGASDSRTWTVTVEDVDRPPVGGIVSPTDRSSYPEGAKIPFVALVYDPDGGTVAYQWYVDAAADGREPSFEGTLPVGDHQVRLVAGSGGAALEDSVSVTVERAPAGGSWLAAVTVVALALSGMAVAAYVAIRRRGGR